MTEATMGTIGSQLNGFGWNVTAGTLKPKNYDTLNFTFNSQATSDIKGSAGSNNDYAIDINANTDEWKIFILNVGDKTLKSHLNIKFNSKDNDYRLNAGKLDGNLTLEGNGGFYAHLADGITGEIHNTNLNTPLHSTGFFFGSYSEKKTVTLGGNITAIGGGAINALRFRNANAEINGSIIAKENGRNNILLEYSNTLTLNGVDNTISNFVAKGGESKLIISANATNTTIENLVLELYTEDVVEDGALTISSDSKKPVQIFTTTLDGGKTLTFDFDNQNNQNMITASPIIGTLKAQNTNQIRFNKRLMIYKLSETAGATKDDTKLTFISEITKHTQNANRVIYIAGFLMVDGSSIDDPANNSSIRDPKLNGTYKMAIIGDGTINPEEIKYNPTAINNVKVAIIKKHNGVGNSTEGASQAELRSQGVIDLGAETDMTLQSDFSLVSFNYRVAETDLFGNSQIGGPKDYITYFLDGEGTGNPQRPQIVQEIILSNVALSTTGLYLANFNSLNKRMGELRDNNHSQGAWGRVFNGQQSNNIGLKSLANFTTIQAGYDYAFGFEGANNFTGFAISYGHSESKFKNEIVSRNNSASIDSSVSDLVEFALYNSYVQDSGWHNDTVAKFSYLMNRIELTGKSSSGAISLKKGDINTYALTLSNEFGYRFKLGASDEWYIDPQAEVGFGYFEGKEFDFSGTKLGTMDSLLTLRGRVGASFGYDFKNFTSRENGLSAKLYLGLFEEFDYFNGGNVKFKGGIAENAIKTDARAVINVGTNLEVKDATRIYVDFESSFGGKITTDYKINAGVRYSFGENANYKSNNGVQKDNEVKEAPIKLQEEEEGEEE